MLYYGTLCWYRIGVRSKNKPDVSSIFLVSPLTIGEEIAAPNVVAIAGKLATNIMK